MRPALRLFQAAATHTPRAVAHWPTGLAGLATHPLPRPALLSIYNATLARLKEMPENSVYRTATEAVTKQRKSIVEVVKPQGWEKYLEDLKKEGLDSPPKYDQEFVTHEYEGIDLAFRMQGREGYEKDDEEFHGLKQWQRTHDEARAELGARNGKEGSGKADEAAYDKIVEEIEGRVESTLQEPNLSIEQVSEIEGKIGGGLIEEVIEAAYNEYQLVDVMVQNKVWEPLSEPQPEGQWTYFERDKM